MKVSDLLSYAKDRARMEEVLRALDVRLSPSRVPSWWASC